MKKITTKCLAIFNFRPNWWRQLFLCFHSWWCHKYYQFAERRHWNIFRQIKHMPFSFLKPEAIFPFLLRYLQRRVLIFNHLWRHLDFSRADDIEYISLIWIGSLLTVRGRGCLRYTLSRRQYLIADNQERHSYHSSKWERKNSKLIWKEAIKTGMINDAYWQKLLPTIFVCRSYWW